MDKCLRFYHKDWIGICILKDDIIYRNNIEGESGKYSINNSELLIEWDNWENEYYININDKIYIEKKYFENIKIYYLLKNNHYTILLYDIKNNHFLENKKIIKDDKIIFLDNEEYIYLSNEIFIFNEHKKYFFNIETVYFNVKKIYILNKYDNTFFELNNMKNKGKYTAENNSLYLEWNNGIQKKYLSNIYYEDNELNYENIKVIRPNKFMINNRILFGNITLIKNKIYLSSVYYKVNPWDLKKINFITKNNNIIKKDIIEYKHYESCIIIILELENEKKYVDLEIEYENFKEIYEIKELKLPNNKIYAMTLFKNDYQLLKKYLEYYYNLGINCFFLYYNDEITDNFINEINIINQSKYEIILVEWNYDYWYYYNQKEKHHHSQVMAINDSLYILKNFCSYVLFNDLDEYIKIEDNFHELIKNYPEIDIYEFKCMFCKMGNELIRYRNFYFEFDENKIIKGNYWDKFREKNLIKINNINLMGVHNIVDEYSKNQKKKYISYFYHFINFYEKNRLELMTQYIS